MNEIVLHRRAAPGDRLQLWVGAFQRKTRPQLSWTLDGEPAQPNVLRHVDAARRPQILFAPDEKRTFTGLYEFTGPSITPGSLHRVTVAADGGPPTAPLDVLTLPAEVPSELDRSFNVLIVSCFHQAEDRQGQAGWVVSRLPQQYRPHLTLLMGDQVYLDLPTLKDYKPTEQWLAREFERKYNDNWRGPDGYARVLNAALNASTPDDHEYWNDFPREQRWIQTTWSESGRGAWRQAAGRMYDAFQRHAPQPAGPALELDVRPLSFFIMDARTHRSPFPGPALDAPQLAQFQAWTRRLRQDRRIGVLVAGQTFLADAAGPNAHDLELADFTDYGEIVRAIRDAANAGTPFLLLTGDVHWGRITRVMSVTSGRPMLFEVISSPASLVTFIGLDQVKTIGAAIKGIFGHKNPWPRHGDPKKPPEFFAKNVLGPSFPAYMVSKEKGNMVCVLSFRRMGFGVTASARYFLIRGDGATPVADVATETLTLTPA